LREKGYNVSIEGGAYLVVRDICYVNKDRQVRHDGVLVTALNMSGEKTIQPSDHTIYFGGECPCDAKGAQLNAIRPDATAFKLNDEFPLQFHFSSKPTRGHYIDHFEKVHTYASILGGHAVAIDPKASPLTFQVVEPEEGSSPFRYLDTASARAEINTITAKLAVERIAIVGLGGTGSYILDLLAKTPVQEIHLFDGDKFASHNAFRAPGAASIEQLHEQPHKVEYLASIYSHMHTGIMPHAEAVDDDNVAQLRDMTFVFLSMDATAVKRRIVEQLEAFDVPFVDTGMGLYAKGDTLGGILRVTLSTAEKRDAARTWMSFSSEEEPNEYDRNIQIADLNMLSAVLAVAQWKKLRDFYFDTKHASHTTYTIGTNRLSNDSDQNP
jgi:hypothetical protein